MKYIQENLVRVIFTVGTLIIIGLISTYFNFQTSAIAETQVSMHNESKVAHRTEFDLFAKSIRKNRSDINVLGERLSNIQSSTDANFARQEARSNRIEGKIDRILEKM